MAHADDATLSQWDACPGCKYMPAAAIARQIHGKPPWTPLTATSALASSLDVSPATISRAKRLLATHGLIQKGRDNQYYTT